MSATGSSTGEYLVWLGAVFTEHAFMTKPAVSPAGNRWQDGILSALRTCGLPCRCLSYLAEPAWPRGPLLVGAADELLSPEHPGALAAYMNAPMVRERHLAVRLRKLFVRMIKQYGAPRAVISYNAPRFYYSVAKFGQEEFGIPWICIVADVPETPAGRAAYDGRIASASGRAYLSWSGYLHARGANRLHLDGGVNIIRDPPRSGISKRAILYSGSLGRFGGVELLLDAFRMVAHPGAELWICGQGSNELISQAVQRDARVRFFGLVSEAELVNLSAKTYAFANPRPSSIVENQFNFPSKVLEYLSYRRPVISTWTPGLAPEYRSVLTIAKDETPSGFARAIEDSLSWTDREQQEVIERISDFLPTRLWSTQATRFVQWLDSAVRHHYA